MGKPLYISVADHIRVTQAVASAEENTSGEIVTIIADRSDGYSDVALAWAIAASFLAMAVFTAIPDFYLGLLERVIGGWQHDWTVGETLTVCLGFGLLKFLGVMLIQLWQPLKFWLIPAPVRTARVHDRAIRAFRMSAERRTHGRTGILIYLSMREHRAEIVADEAIATRVSPEVWGDAMEAMLEQIKQGRIADGMIAAVSKVGEVLTAHLPGDDENPNELPDRLIEV